MEPYEVYIRPTDGYSTRAHPPPLTEARLGSRSTSARTRSTYIRERTTTRTRLGICTPLCAVKA